MLIIAVIVAIIVVIILLTFHFAITYPRDVVDYNKDVPLADFNPHNLNTGDIILFRYEYLNCINCGLLHGGILEHESLTEYLEMLLTRTKNQPHIFTHIAIVVILNDIPYLLDCTPYAGLGINGEMVSHRVALYDISYIKNYPGNVYYHKYLGSRKDISHKFVQNELNLGMPFQADAVSVIDAILGTDLCNRSKKSGTCVSNVLNTLDKLNIINTPVSKHLHYSPADVHEMLGNKYDVVKLIRNDFYHMSRCCNN